MNELYKKVNTKEIHHFFYTEKKLFYDGKSLGPSSVELFDEVMMANGFVKRVHGYILDMYILSVYSWVD